jgi:hypothetical protein
MNKKLNETIYELEREYVRSLREHFPTVSAESETASRLGKYERKNLPEIVMGAGRDCSAPQAIRGDVKCRPSATWNWSSRPRAISAA